MDEIKIDPQVLADEITFLRALSASKLSTDFGISGLGKTAEQAQVLLNSFLEIETSINSLIDNIIDFLVQAKSGFITVDEASAEILSGLLKEIE